MSQQKLQVVFIGSFRSSADDGTVGGQGFACQSLVNSYLTNDIDWLLIDTTQKAQPPPSMTKRTWYASLRVVKLLEYLLLSKVDTLLIFSSYSIASFAEKGLIAIIGALFRKRVVLAIRSEVRPFPSDRYARLYRKLVLTACDQVICQTAANVAALELQFGKRPEKYAVVPNWLNFDQYKQITTSDLSKQLPQGENNNHAKKMHFIYLGWLIPNKGIIELIDAATILRQQAIEFHLHICGGGALKEIIKTKISQNHLENYITLHGWVYGEQKLSLLHKSQVLILPSYSEGMPNAVLEGMSASLAIVGTRIGGIKSLIQSEDQGYLVPPKDPISLANAMASCIDDPIQVTNMGKYNRKIVKANHSLESVLPKFEQCIGLVKS